MQARSWADTRPLDPSSRKPKGLDLLPGTTISLGKRCGRGGSGIVYRAIDRASGDALAVKVQREDRLSNCEGLMIEAEILQQVSVPWVVGFRGCGLLPQGRPWLAMEFLEGRSLARAIDERVEVDLVQVTDWLRQACLGLGAIHDAGWVHRDVKPSNLVVVDEPEGSRLVVIDLGIAARIGDLPDLLCGTPEYIAPEQAQRKRADIRSDIYALGCCAYELLTGRPLVSAKGALATIQAHVGGVEVQWPSDVEVPFVLRRLVERCVARAPEARPPNMYVLYDQLARVRAELLRLQSSPSLPPRVTVCEVTTVIQEPIVVANDGPPIKRARSEAARRWSARGDGLGQWLRSRWSLRSSRARATAKETTQVLG